MSQKYVHIKSFGCQMNKLDSALVASAITQAGFSLTNTLKKADAVIINTCSVRSHAEQRVLSHLGRLTHIRKTRPNLVVAVIGCMAQRLGQTLLEYEAVDIVCGPVQITQITGLLKNALDHRQKTLAVTKRIRTKAPAQQAEALEQFELLHGRRHTQLPNQAFVRAMRGCNNFCTYCIVPYVRGPEVSRPPAAVIEQIKNLADNGVVKVTLLGQTINSYSYKAGQKTYCLADLLEMASRVNGIEWLSFVTSYPSTRFFDQILKAVADLPKVCPYLHMPAQSGSDKILKAMNRHYTVAEYLKMLQKTRDIVPEIALSGDFIVGFPGETEEDFAQTLRLVENANYKNCFVFKYSPRPATAAEKTLPDSVPLQTKKKRNTQLLALQENISRRLSARFLGKTLRVLVEGPSKKPHLDAAQNQQMPQLVARTAADYIVVFNGPKSLAGRFANVKITKTAPLTLFAQLIPGT